MQTLNLRLARDNLSRPWGFRLQGGSDTGYPLSIQRVFSGSPAEGILQKNDEIKLLDNCDVENASLKEVQDLIRTSGNQLNFIVVRDSNKPKNYSNDQNEEIVSVKAARMKFLNNENRSPQPFGQFGTQFQKKANTLPTSLMIETNHEFMNPQKEVMHKNQQMDDDDIADYNFMTLPVSERKKLFASPNENSISKTLPRQRSYSFRPSHNSYQSLPKAQSNIYQKKPQQYGWGPSAEKMERARHITPNQSTVPMRYQSTLASSPKMSRNQEQITNSQYSGYQTTPRLNQNNRRFSSSTTIPRFNGQNLTSSTLNFSSIAYQNPNNRVKSQTKYIYHCGRKNDMNSADPSILIIPAQRQQQNLYVNTYSTANQASSPTQSPRYFRPAYPAYSTDHSVTDNVSIMSTRSEPYSKRLDRSIGYDKPGSYRINRDSSSMQRDISHQMDNLQIGHPRTRVIADPASPSCHLNWSFWGPNSQTNSQYEQPIIHNNVQNSPRITEIRPPRKVQAVPKSQSTLVMHPSRSTNDSVYEQVAWLKQHRDSLTGVSDF